MIDLRLGDCRVVLASMASDSIDAIVTDPPYGLSFMGKGWDHGVPGVPFWTETLRVAKPGTHLLAFGGTRTHHRLMVAIEDAGWEIRDCLMWLYGSGFPKSLDVSKAIDKAAGAEREERSSGWRSAPATEAAQRWDGWGTALKPAWEPIIVARKPLESGRIYVRWTVESELRKRGVDGEIRWSTTDDASDAEPRRRTRTSSSTEAQRTAGTFAGSVEGSGTPSAEQRTPSPSVPPMPNGEGATLGGRSSTIGSRADDSESRFSPPMETPARVAENDRSASSRSTTSTEAEQHTEDPSIPRSTPSFAEKDSRPDTESFVGIATGLTGSMATVRIERASDGSFRWPERLPVEVAGRPLTVADNVIRYGTGAINIDGGRIGTDKVTTHSRGANGAFPKQVGATEQAADQRGGLDTETERTGRWPANVILDEEAGALLDAQAESKIHSAGFACVGMWDGGYEATSYQVGGPGKGRRFGDRGGASRFFYTAKASRSERTADGHVDNRHPTVKPTDLMEYLVRLVTPPGGTVLDPFMGSGSTGVAAEPLGFSFVGIEQDHDSFEVAKRRLSRPYARSLFGRATG